MTIKFSFANSEFLKAKNSAEELEKVIKEKELNFRLRLNHLEHVIFVEKEKSKVLTG